MFRHFASIDRVSCSTRRSHYISCVQTKITTVQYLQWEEGTWKNQKIVDSMIHVLYSYFLSYDTERKDSANNERSKTQQYVRRNVDEKKHCIYIWLVYFFTVGCSWFGHMIYGIHAGAAVLYPTIISHSYLSLLNSSLNWITYHKYTQGCEFLQRRLKYVWLRMWWIHIALIAEHFWTIKIWARWKIHPNTRCTAWSM